MSTALVCHAWGLVMFAIAAVLTFTALWAWELGPLVPSAVWAGGGAVMWRLGGEPQ